MAIDAVAAKLMGFDPLSIPSCKIADERGLGCGDPREIESSETRAAREMELRRAVREDDLASRMQHLLLGPLKKPSSGR